MDSLESVYEPQIIILESLVEIMWLKNHILLSWVIAYFFQKTCSFFGLFFILIASTQHYVSIYLDSLKYRSGQANMYY